MKPFAVSTSARASRFAIPCPETNDRAPQVPKRAIGNNTLATDRFFQSMSSTGRLRPAMRAAWAHSHHQGTNV